MSLLKRESDGVEDGSHPHPALWCVVFSQTSKAGPRSGRGPERLPQRHVWLDPGWWFFGYMKAPTSCNQQAGSVGT